MYVSRLLLAAIILLGAHGLIGAAATSSAAGVSGEAYALAVGLPSRPVVGAPYVTLPPEGGTVSEFSAGAGVGTGGGVSNADRLGATSTGSPAGAGGTVTSTATVGFIELFAGLIRATDVQVSATSSVGGGRAFSSGTVTFGSLTVAGLPYPNPRPNERVELPGLGYVVLNEQLIGGDGQNTTSIIVRAMRLQVTAPMVFGVPQETEFIVANAASGIPDIAASRAVAPGPAPTATDVPWSPIRTITPPDLDFGNGNGNDNDDFDNFNENGNDNGGATGTPGTGGGGGGAASPVVVTVVVVITTPTSTPTPTVTPTPGGSTSSNR